jgi:LysR family transcriptional regulator for metE and metH
MAVVVDDEDRENEGDLIMAAAKATPQAVNFMAKHARGLICVSLPGSRCRELDLPPQSIGNTALHGTAFTVAVDGVRGTTTCISAHDRVATIRALIDPRTRSRDLARPGHVFPLRAAEGGVLRRAGHTEAAADLARLAGGTAGRLHMAIECHSCFQWLMPTIDQFRDAWPEVELDLASGFSFAPLPALARGDLDLVVTSDPLELAGITYVPLFTYEAMLAVANQHPLASKPFIQPEDLATETLITYPVERARLDIFTRFLEPADVEPAQVRTSVLSVMIMQLVASGRGVCGLPNWALHEYSSRGYVTAKRLGDKGLFATLYAGIRTDMLDSPFMRDFLLTAKDTSFANLEGVSVAR